MRRRWKSRRLGREGSRFLPGRGERSLHQKNIKASIPNAKRVL